MRMLAVVGLASALAAAGCSAGAASRSAPAGSSRSAQPSAASSPSAAASVPPACGRVSPGQAHYQHVVWIWMENKDYSAVLGSAQAPYESRLAAGCGLATDYRGVAHPSLPNYLAATGGSTFGVSDDARPAAHRIGGASLFGQVAASGRQWRSYAESMPGPCALASSGQYAVKHNPAAYYTAIRAQCAAWDLPMGPAPDGAFATALSSGRLPAFTLVTPNLCHDDHDCPVSAGDSWLAAWVPRIVASPAYTSTAVFVVFDESEGDSSGRLPCFVVAPGTPVGARLSARADHYSLLQTTEALLGLPALNANAARASSLLPLTGG